ncbi:MAG: VWA domain-containing protein [Spirochaetaceae bacterium]|jgi:hypothetical protein|nr:VWA domain-containing protein [Spirochaetaceae bacterium]
MKARLVFGALFLCAAAGLTAADFSILGEDLRLEPVYEIAVPAGTDASGVFESISGYHLYVRKKPDIQSVLLTETTKDPAGRVDNYAYRALEWNPVNGDEIRYLNGRPLVSEWATYSIVDSTPEPDDLFGQAFHLFIPRTMVYGYPWTRNGEVTVDRGIFINIRAFGAYYADYAGGFADNPFMFDFSVIRPRRPAPQPAAQAPAMPAPPALPVPELSLTGYSPPAVDAFTDIAEFGGGGIRFSRGPEDLIDRIMETLTGIPRSALLEVVFAIDATGSMKDDVAKLRQDWMPRLVEALSGFAVPPKLGLLLYRDYTDTYRYHDLPVKFFPFTTETPEFFRNLNSFQILGTEGGDVPEAVYEALWGAMDCYEWNPRALKKVVLIGDAEPHEKPRGSGKYSREMIERTARERGITIDTIIIPDNRKNTNRGILQ